MQIKTILRKGVDHKVYCEDYLYSFQNDNWIIAATFDGCSDGIDSHFASSLSGKILKSIIQQSANSLTDSLSTEDVYNFIIFNFLLTLEEMRLKLSLAGNELLSTMILLVYNKQSEVGKVIAMGDGIVVIDGEMTIIDQNNEPEYPITYAGKITGHFQDVITFLETHKNQWTFRGFKDVTISTDGHQQWKHKTDINKKFQEAMDFFIYDTEMNNLEVMLARKYNILKLKGWENHDDLGMIRIINNEEKNTETEAIDNGRIYSENE
jgi:hypothetical protein